MRCIRRRGFTLVEVMVALGITASALILLLSANRNALQRSLRARDRVQFEHACESKLDEIQCGVETSLNGQFEQPAGYVWSIRQESADLDAVTKLQRITLQVSSPNGVLFTKALLHYGPLQENNQVKGNKP